MLFEASAGAMQVRDETEQWKRGRIMTQLINGCEDSLSKDDQSVIPRVNILGVGVTPVNIAQAVATLESWRVARRREYVCCTSVHGLVESQRDPYFRRILSRAALTTEDGMPLVWWCRHAGFKDAGRVCGRDLLEAMCAVSAAHGHRHFFYGGAPGIAERLVFNLTQRFPGLVVVGHRSPPFRPATPEEDAADVEAINETRPDFVWVGLGTPKQDRWMADHVGKIDATALIGVGAAFDFLAGVKRQAPLWMQHSGLEWAFRLATEPRRLARRYLVGNSIFIGCAAKQFFRWKSYAQEMGE
jgi:N-acetylglucosaminyldiphosphoundecaprenol N-acetyl-beta-D-mannosaminyltransferase